MTFKEILATVKEKAKEIDGTQTNFLAVQVNLTGENGGVFYVEIKDGKVSAEPYEYNDRSCAITMSPENFLKFLNGKLDPVLAFTTGKLKVDGDVGKALEFSKLVR
ncbi:MAG: SCP2 sterol-binding domain-containing protein [Oscillospiraceae bacterium]|nr:SCP2 sterol-binding domain-containing protein [Oscillospiraceae bacterium]